MANRDENVVNTLIDTPLGLQATSPTVNGTLDALTNTMGGLSLREAVPSRVVGQMNTHLVNRRICESEETFFSLTGRFEAPEPGLLAFSGAEQLRQFESRHELPNIATNIETLRSFLSGQGLETMSTNDMITFDDLNDAIVRNFDVLCELIGYDWQFNENYLHPLRDRLGDDFDKFPNLMDVFFQIVKLGREIEEVEEATEGSWIYWMQASEHIYAITKRLFRSLTTEQQRKMGFYHILLRDPLDYGAIAWINNANDAQLGGIRNTCPGLTLHDSKVLNFIKTFLLPARADIKTINVMVKNPNEQTSELLRETIHTIEVNETTSRIKIPDNTNMWMFKYGTIDNMDPIDRIFNHEIVAYKIDRPSRYNDFLDQMQYKGYGPLSVHGVPSHELKEEHIREYVSRNSENLFYHLAITYVENEYGTPFGLVPVLPPVDLLAIFTVTALNRRIQYYNLPTEKQVYMFTWVASDMLQVLRLPQELIYSINESPEGTQWYTHEEYLNIKRLLEKFGYSLCNDKEVFCDTMHWCRNREHRPVGPRNLIRNPLGILRREVGGFPVNRNCHFVEPELNVAKPQSSSRSLDFDPEVHSSKIKTKYDRPRKSEAELKYESDKIKREKSIKEAQSKKQRWKQQSPKSPNYNPKAKTQGLFDLTIRHTLKDERIVELVDGLTDTTKDFKSLINEIRFSGLKEAIARTADTATDTFGQVGDAISGVNAFAKFLKKCATIVVPLAIGAYVMQKPSLLSRIGGAAVVATVMNAITPEGLWDYIKKYFTQETARPQMDGVNVDPLAKIVTLGLTYFAVDKRDLHTISKSALHAFGQVPRAMDGSKKISETIIQGFESLVNTVGKHFGKSRIQLLTSNSILVNAWATRVDQFYERHARGELPTVHNVSYLKSLRREGEWLRNEYRMDKEVSKYIQDATRQLDKLTVEYSSAINGLTGLRREPICMLLYGKPGVGKSKMCQRLLVKIMARVMDPLRVKALDRDLSKDIFSKGPSEYYEGYCGQFAIVHDDFGQAVAVPGEDNEYVNFIREANCWPFPLNMASLESKGKNFFTSELILCTTNVDNLRLKTESVVTAPTAIGRRFNFSYHVKVKEEYRKADTTEDDEDCIDKEKAKHAPNGDIWELHRCDPMTKKKEVGEPISMDDLVNLVVAQYNRASGEFESEVDYIKQLQEELLNDRFGEAARPQMAGTSRKDEDEFFPAEGDEEEIKTESILKVENMTARVKDGKVECANSFKFLMGAMRNRRIYVKDRIVIQKDIGRYITINEYMNSEGKIVREVNDISPIIGPIMDWIIEDAVIKEQTTRKKVEEMMRSVWDMESSRFSVKFEYEQKKGSDWEFQSKTYSCETTKIRESAKNYLDALAKRVFENPLLGTLAAMAAGGLIFMVVRWIVKGAMSAYDKWTGHHSVKPELVRKMSKFDKNSQETAFDAVSYFRAEDFETINIPNEDGKLVETRVVTEKAFLEAMKRYKAAKEEKMKPKEEPKPKEEVKAAPQSGEKSTDAVPIDVAGGDALCDPKTGDTIEFYDGRSFTKEDKVGIDIARKCAQNVFVFWYRKPQGDKYRWFYPGHVQFVSGNYVLMPTHYLCALKYEVACGVISKDDPVKLQNATNPANFIPLTVKDILNNEKVPSGWDNKDLSFVKIPSGTAPKSILKHFLTEADLKKIKRSKIRLETCEMPSVDNPTRIAFRTRCAYGTFIESVRSEDEKYDYSVTIKEAIRYNINTSDGDCGGFVYMDEGSHLEGRRIVGMHTAGINGCGYAPIISQEMIAKAIAELKLIDYEEPLGEDKKIKCQSNKLPLGISGSFIPLFEINGKAFSAARSKIVQTPLHNSYTLCTKVPAPLGRFTNPATGEKVEPMKKAVSNYSGPIVNIDERRVEFAMQDVFRDLFNRTQMCPRRVLTMEEAILGVKDGAMDCKAIPRSTSAGYPWNMQGYQAKYDFFGREDDYEFNSPAYQKLKHEVLRCLELIKSGIRPFFVFHDFLKDETRSIEKAMAGDTRMISNSPLVYTILFRMYFLDWCLAIGATRIYNGIAVGMNVYSKEADLLVQYMTSKGPDDVAGDFSKFDSNQQQGISRPMVSYINEWYGGSPEDNLVREILWMEVYHSRHLNGDVIYQWNKSLPSGHPATSYINSIYNKVLFRLCYMDVFGDTNIVEFSKHVAEQVYGDDNLANIHRSKVKEYNQASIAKCMLNYGMIYTSEDKQSEVADTRTIKEVTFLKRGFRWEKEWSRWVMPLNMQSILFMPMWCEDASRCDTITKVNVERALTELALHSKDTWDLWASPIYEASKKIMGYIPQYGLDRSRYLSSALSKKLMWWKEEDLGF